MGEYGEVWFSTTTTTVDRADPLALVSALLTGRIRWSALTLAVRLAAIISVTIGIAGIVVQVRTTGLDVDSVIAGAFIGVVLTGAVVVAATELIRRRNRAWLTQRAQSEDE